MDDTDNLTQQPVVTAFLRHSGKILLVRRSDRVGSYQGRWSGISGYLDDPTAFDQALREIYEETGLQAHQVRLVASAASIPVPAPDLEKLWIVHPFLFDVEEPDAIRLDWENLELCWAQVEELADFATVPALEEALRACLAAEDSAHE